MNRLVIIGNGFDLAHGLQSKYSDFIKKMILSSVQKFHSNGSFENPLFRIANKYRGHREFIPSDYLFDAFSLFEKLKEHDYIYSEIKSDLFRRLLLDILNKKWVDVEREYFKTLGIVTQNGSNLDMGSVSKLNSEFDFIRNSLNDYLFELSNSFEIRSFNEYSKLFTREFSGYRTSVLHLKKPKSVLILNFNYTPLIKSYVTDSLRREGVTHISIHGEVGSSDNPIILGYGDENESLFRKLEEFGETELVRYFKSFAYPKNGNYLRLIDYIESSMYEVDILGHSLGHSDKIMLSEIFNHPNCFKVNLFHFGDDGLIDYQDKVYAVSRHFKDKALMLRKVSEFDHLFSMPQLL